MSELRPAAFTWSEADEAMRPAPRFRQLCKRQFTDGETYVLEEREESSDKERARYFASIREAWLNLPEDRAAEYPSTEHLRKRALIKCGHYTERPIVCDNERQAIKVAAVARSLDEFIVVQIKGPVVRLLTAKSQKKRSMNRQEFHASAEDVLHLLDDMIGTRRGTLAQEGRRA